jgi:hypothetical protein
VSDYKYRPNITGPSMVFACYDYAGNLIDLSSGYTFAAYLSAEATPNTIAATKSSGITGAATSPNLIVDWSTSDFSGLTADPAGAVYLVHVKVTRTLDSETFMYDGQFSFFPTLT